MRNRYNQAQHLNQDTNWKVTTSQLDLTNVFVFLPRGAAGWTVVSVCGIITAVPIGSDLANSVESYSSVESYLGRTSRIYFHNVTLT